ncbi:MAG: hypothetical protein M3Z21_00135 [Pseudomonadota bacterium]|nr:hypothetical protein [Pseudomonadota bacterium]
MADDIPVDALADEPTACCPLDGGNHWWRDSDGWRCSDCTPMPQGFTGESLTLPKPKPREGRS